MTLLQPVSPLTADCKCCGAAASLYGVVDFHKNCEIYRRRVLTPSGIPVYYHRCPQCAFIFTTAFDSFSPEDFHARVYNDEYILVDPDFLESRPRDNAAMIGATFGGSKDIRILDYGGGNGSLATRLRDQGFTRVDTYDPFVAAHAARPQGRYDCILSFEVMEHSPTPRETFHEINALLDPDGVVLFTTLLQPHDMDALGVNWWYLGPRNGHVSLYSRDAVTRIVEPLGFQFGSFGDGTHLLFRRLPPWARHLVPGPQN